jgi:hypothetical protein
MCRWEGIVDSEDPRVGGVVVVLNDFYFGYPGGGSPSSVSTGKDAQGAGEEERKCVFIIT